MLFIGLHMTKCAGTSLAMQIRNNLPSQQWYLCSGFRDMQKLGFVQLAERTEFDKLRIIFGHFVHDSLFSIAGERRVFLFTGIRSPVERAVSEFYHMCKIRRRLGRPALTADEFFRQRKNTMCVEILRAFPTLAGEAAAPLSTRAIEAAQMFDFVYETEDFESSIEPVLRLLKIGDIAAINANVREISAQDDTLKSVEEEIRARCADHFAEDFLLYEYLKPHAGKMYPFGSSGAVSPKRRQWETAMRAREDGQARLSEHFAKHFVADYRNLGALDELNALLRRKQGWLDKLSEFASKA